MTPATRLKRLTTACEIISAIPVKHFQMSTWWKERGDVAKPRATPECGTAGCALGWLAASPRTPGLRLVRDEFFSGESLSVFEVFYRDSKGDGHEDEDAGAAYLGITEEEAKKLFYSAYYRNPDKITKHQVLVKLKHLIKTYSTPSRTGAPKS